MAAWGGDEGVVSVRRERAEGEGVRVDDEVVEKLWKAVLCPVEDG